MNCSDRSITLSVKNLADCWWQIPPFGKDFQAFSHSENDDFPEFGCFRDCGTTLVWL
jgi:hypothetical protein